MSLVTIVWSMVAAACLTLAAMHLLVWSRRRSAWAHLLFSLSATAIAAYAGCELWMMLSGTPREFGMALRWAHVPAWVIVVSLAVFVRLYLRAGRLWLAWAVCGVRTLALLLNFGPAPNLNYREISTLRHVPFLGDTVSVGEGVRNPWMLIGLLSLLLLVIFVADASLAAWRRGDRQRALLVGGSVAFFAAGSAIESFLVLGQVVQAPLTATLLYLGLMAAMGYQLSDDALRAARLSDELLLLQADLAHVGRLSTMSQLAASLAHELNQPLGAILRNAEAAQLLLQSRTPDLEELRAILADICSDDQRAGGVIDHMRALVKRRGLERVELRLAELVDEVVVLVQPDAASRKVRLGVEVPMTLPPVRGDRVHLQQVLLNLILNAMDAMDEVPAENRRLVVRARRADDKTIEVAIADAGRGVAAAKLARLFEPFFTTKPEGMGLGLPISASIIGAHGGRIWADSGPAGATFYFTVPVSSQG
jgi:signal transduction histidine kinase